MNLLFGLDSPNSAEQKHTVVEVLFRNYLPGVHKIQPLGQEYKEN